LWVQI